METAVVNGALTMSGANSILNNNIVLASDSSVGASGTGTLGGVISGAFNLAKSGSGTLNLRWCQYLW